MITDEWFDLPDLLDNVQELLDLGLFDEAQAMLEKYKTVFSDDWEYHFVYSRVYTEQNRPREAIPCLIRGLRIERNNVECLLGLFYAYAMMGRIKRGGKFLLKAAEVDTGEFDGSGNDLVLSAMIWYYTEMNDLDAALDAFERAQRANSINPETYRNGGIVFDRLGRYAEAEECYKSALTIAPGFEEARDLYADHLIVTGRSDDAVKLYEEALQNSPKNIRHMSKLIYCLSQKGDFDSAAAMSAKSIELYPNSPVGYIDLAYVNLNRGRLEEAAENAEMAVSVSPIDAEGYRVKAITCSELGQFDEAEESFKQAASLDPEGIDILRDYYQHLRAAGKYEEMLEAVNKAIKLEFPFCTEDYWFLADFYRERNQNVKAFHYLRLAYKSMPSEKELLPPMIEILLEQGHTNYSLPMFAAYVQKSGWNESMSNFMMNKQFRGRFTQEGIRFLRFTGQRPMEYRKYVFNYYLYRYGFIFYTVIVATLLFPASVLLGWAGAGGIAVVYALSLGAIKLTQVVQFKMAMAKAMKQASVAKGP